MAGVSTTSTTFDLLNPEQRKKFDLVSERVDYRGVVHRNKIENQTIYDVMLVNGCIEQPQHEAMFLFLDAVSKSGAYVASVSWDDLYRDPARNAANRMSERRMAYSEPYRFMVEDCGQGNAAFLMETMNHLYFIPESKKEARIYSSWIAESASYSLWSLVKFYRLEKKRDPRSMIKVMLVK
jgi:hypothetical protein